MKKSDDNSDSTILRRKAEVLFKKQNLNTDGKLSESDTIKLIHELEVNKIELEMQNLELKLAKEQAAIATDKFIELYDLAPSVFVTLAASGKIERITMRGASMLGQERSKLFYFNFEKFVTDETKHEFKAFFEKIFKNQRKETCQVGLITEDNLPLYVQMDGLISENGKKCYISITDITLRKMAEQALIIANRELAFENKEKEKRAAELSIANKELAFQNREKERRAAELLIANQELAFQNAEKEKRAAELIIANQELAFQNAEKERRAAELLIANQELAFQNAEKERRAAELVVANEELAFQNAEKERRAAELIVANQELAFQNEEKAKRAAELIIANKNLENHVEHISHFAAIVESTDNAIISKSLDGTIKSWNNAAEKMFGYSKEEAIGKNITIIIPPEYIYEEVIILNRIKNNENIDNYETVRKNKSGENIYVALTISAIKDQSDNIIGVSKIARDITLKKKSEAELINKTEELVNANQELAIQNAEKEKRAAELVIANKELAIQNAEKEKRAAELVIANKELAYQNAEKEKRAAELVIVNKELALQNEEIEIQMAKRNI